MADDNKIVNEPDENDIEVILEDDKGHEKPVEVVAEPEETVEDPSLAIQELRKKIQEAEARAKEAEDRARNESMRAKKALDEVEDTNIQLVNNAIESVKSDNASLKVKMRSALAIGDHEVVADIQEAMSLNSAKLLQLENGLEAMRAQVRKPPQSVDILDDFKSKVSRRSAEWAEANPEYIRNPRLFQKVVAAHNLVTADGVAPDTDEYFSKVENILGISRSVEEAPAPQSAPRRAPASPAAAPPSAPPSRSSATTGSKPSVVRLSSEEREAARQFGMTDKEYANAKLALQKEGRLN